MKVHGNRVTLHKLLVWRLWRGKKTWSHFGKTDYIYNFVCKNVEKDAKEGQSNIFLFILHLFVQKICMNTF